MTRAVAFVVAAALCQCAVAHEPQVVTADDRVVTPFPGHNSYLLSGADGTPSKAAVLQIELPARTFGAPPHVHSLEDEHFYVLDGEVEFLDRDQTVTAGVGSLVVLPRGHLHGFWNATEAPARMLLVVTPGEFASFFDSVVAEIRRDAAVSPERIPAIIASVAAEYGVEVRPDKIPAAAQAVLPK